MEKGKKKAIKISSTILVVFLLLSLTCVLIFNAVYIKSKVVGLSMYPTLNSEKKASDRVFINKYEKGTRGDIVVADIREQSNWDHTLEGDYVVKRLVAVEGDKIQILKLGSTQYELRVNDKVLYTKEYADTPTSYLCFVSYVSAHLGEEDRIQNNAVIIKQNEIFLMGDNWNSSYDSTSCGPLTESSLVGRVDISVPKNEFLLFGIIKGIFKQIF